MTWSEVSGRVCEVEICDRQHYSGGYCQPHYRRVLKHGTPGEAAIGQLPSYPRKGKSMCSFEGCTYRSFTRGLCDAHDKQRRRGRDLSPVRIRGPILGRRESNLRSRYNITGAMYDEMLKNQSGVCAICGAAPRPGVKYWSELSVDHDRSCCPTWKSCGNCVRGLLCKMCNVGIGNLGDDPERLESAVRYLRERKIETTGSMKIEIVGVSPEDDLT